MIFVTGWAGDSAQYPLISGQSRFLVPFKDFEPGDLSPMLEEGGDVLVGWSTGAHILLKECPHLFSKFRRVVLVAPFMAFTDSFPERLLRNMIAGMDDDPAEVVSSFHVNCGEELELDFQVSRIPELVRGLEFLITSKIENAVPPDFSNLTIVHGKKDRIVRKKAFKRVMETVTGTDIIELDCGHKVPEDFLLRIINNE